MPEIINFSLIALLALWIFSIFFLNLLKGKFYKCIFEGESSKYLDSNLIKNMYDCYNYGGNW